MEEDVICVDCSSSCGGFATRVEPAMHTTGVALIVGAGGGIGRETGHAFAENGARGVVFADVSLDAATASANESKKFASCPDYRAIAVKTDIRREEEVVAMVQSVIGEFGGVDYCINAAGIGVEKYTRAAEDGAIQDYDRKMALNARGTLLVMQAVIPIMQKQEPLHFRGRHGVERDVGRGAIVNLGSVLSHTALPSMLGYVSSKHAVLASTKICALDYASYGIRINAIAPGWVHTPMMAKTYRETPEIDAMIKRMVPIKRMAEPEEIADFIVFMCSPQASYMNGTCVTVDAGTSLTMFMQHN